MDLLCIAIVQHYNCFGSQPGKGDLKQINSEQSSFNKLF